jgi:hypothetical protein
MYWHISKSKGSVVPNSTTGQLHKVLKIQKKIEIGCLQLSLNIFQENQLQKIFERF